MQTKCVLIKLKPNTENKVREWAATLNSRRDEVNQTLRDEGVVLESVFLAPLPDASYLVYLMRAENMEKAQAVAKQSLHPIDAYHKQFKTETWETREVLENLIDFALEPTNP